MKLKTMSMIERLKHFQFTVTNILIIFYVNFYIIGLLLPGFTRLLALNGTLVLVEHQYWRVFTSEFVHGGIAHLLLNSLFIFQIGNLVEAILGKKRYFILLFITIITSSAVVVFTDIYFQRAVYTLGSSGFGYGLIGAIVAFAILFPQRYYRRLAQNLLFNVVIYSLFFFFMTPGLVSFEGHIGGFIGGLVTIALLQMFWPKENW